PESFVSMLTLIIPALFGGVFMQFAIKSPKTAIFALTISLVMTKLVNFIPGKPAFLITLVSVFSSIVFAKKLMEREHQNG
ncbi:MAG: hypothetical protein ACRC4S_03090, partial [Cetobacterium sp.]